MFFSSALAEKKRRKIKWRDVAYPFIAGATVLGRIGGRNYQYRTYSHQYLQYRAGVPDYGGAFRF